MMKVCKAFKSLYFTFNSFSHIEQKNTKYGISSINTSHKILDIFLTFS